ncbi:TnsD family transposase [Ammoniphilus sp. CFH 90114]|uniref:TnsD family transposase n=1 Tax=Ammoniphilus sp. CFH 90114 TaxID=2493665 RepID=UPI001F0C50DA|nr:TnsD family transposase [Ammoniphilus sp. CFH 90114]
MFPRLYPDELLYSGIARYHQRMSNPSFKQTIEDLYGDRKVSSAVDLPSHLQRLADCLDTGYTVEKLLKEHTLLPYYISFLAEESASKANCIMKAGQPWGAVHAHLGLIACRVKNPSYLRYCSACYIEDIKEYGEPYWHRVHQLPGVLVCPQHHKALSKSNILFSTKDHKHSFFPLSTVINEGQVFLSYNPEEWQNLIFVAEQSEILLNGQKQQNGFESLNEKYTESLRKLGLVSVSGKKKISKIIDEFKRYYSEEFLQHIGCEIHFGIKETWLHKLLRKPKNSFHPLRHILVLKFLNADIEMKSCDTVYLPFGSSPWPCLNKAADHFGELTIMECKITSCFKTRLPVGTFSCFCGFIYARQGPDKTPDDRYRRGRVKSFGSVWFNRLSELKLLGKSSRSMAATLGVDPGTVKNQLSKAKQDKKEPNKKVNDEELALRRGRMIQTIHAYKEEGRKAIQKANSRDYSWLYRHNREWLFQQLPERKQKKKSIPRVDWKSRDQKLSKIVEKSIKEIKCYDEPIKISVAAVGRHIDERVLLDKHLNKMPQTKMVLLKYLETTEQFQIRRLEWAAKKIKQEIKLNGWKLLRYAGISSNVTESVFEKIQDLLAEHDNLFVANLKRKHE